MLLHGETMKRRQLIRYAKVALFASLGTGFVSQFQSSQAQTDRTLSVRWLGHTSFLFTGEGRQILVNPFRTLGCTANYRRPNVKAELVLASSRLLDEGAVEGLPGNPKLLLEPGIYPISSNFQIQAIRTDHDRLGGRRFGDNLVWKWTQAGVNILHLGGAAAPLTLEQKILMGRPDILLVPVGGGVKAYAPEEAKAVVQALSPKLVIPTHYRTEAAAADACDLVPLDAFLSLMKETPIQRAQGDSISITPAGLPKAGPVIQVLSYPF